jgi:murein DD-endopeptidase MepM/ murein hydrolase activator NlpD
VYDRSDRPPPTAAEAAAGDESGATAGGTSMGLLSERVKTTIAVLGVLAISAMPAFAADDVRVGSHFGAGSVARWADLAAAKQVRWIPAGPFVPVVGEVDYGTAENAFGAARSGHVHSGQDIFAPAGTPEVAAADGVVIERGSDGGQGNYVYLYDPDGDRTYVYMHMIAPASVKAGERVSAGEKLGGLGCTGSCWGDHLHFEIREGRGIEGEPIDPMPHLSDWQRLDQPL